MNFTSVEQINNFYFKRDDYYNQFGVYGGKVRSAYKIITENKDKEIKSLFYSGKIKGFTTAGSKQSPK